VQDIVASGIDLESLDKKELVGGNLGVEEEGDCTCSRSAVCMLAMARL
jgi:hypothetical protein